MRVYICGDMTKPNYIEEFAIAEKSLWKRGFTPLNPAEIKFLLPNNIPKRCIVEITFAMLKYSEAIYMLDGWKKSKDALLEHEYATNHKLQIIGEES